MFGYFNALRFLAVTTANNANFANLLNSSSKQKNMLNDQKRM